MPRPERASALRTPSGVLIAAGQAGVGSTLTAALLSLVAARAGCRVLLCAPAPRAERLTRWLAAGDPLGRTPAGISVTTDLPALIAGDLVVLAPEPRADTLGDAAELLSARTSGTRAVLLVPPAPSALAAAFAGLKVLTARRPMLPVTALSVGGCDAAPLVEAADRWLGRTVTTASPLPFDPTLPGALGAGVPLADAIGDPTLPEAASALWSSLSLPSLAGAPA